MIYNVASLETQPSQERVQTRNPCGNIVIPDCQRSCSSRGVCRWTADVNVLFRSFRFEHDRNNSIGRCQHPHPGSRLTKLFFGPVSPQSARLARGDMTRASQSATVEALFVSQYARLPRALAVIDAQKSGNGRAIGRVPTCRRSKILSRIVATSRSERQMTTSTRSWTLCHIGV